MARTKAATTSSPKTTKTLGRKVMASLIPRYFRNQTDLQNATGIAYSTINDWNSGKSNPREEVLEKVVAALRERHGVETTAADILAGAIEPIDEITVAHDERYPNRVLAVEFARRDGVSDAAIDRVSRMLLHSDSDPSPGAWFDMMRDEDRRLKMGIRDPLAIEEEQRRSDVEASRHEADAHRIREEGRAKRKQKSQRDAE